jgi:polar amino acid transport system substrate-binding protein
MIALPAFRTLLVAAMASALSFGAARAADDFDLSPQQPGRLHAARNDAAIAAIPKDFKFVTSGKFTIAVSPGGPPLATYATDAKTVVGADPDYANAIADSLGLTLEIVPVAWIDWPLGLTSGKYDAVISNVGVTEQRKEKFDFSTYRQGLHGFFVKSDSPITAIKEPRCGGPQDHRRGGHQPGAYSGEMERRGRRRRAEADRSAILR